MTVHYYEYAASSQPSGLERRTTALCKGIARNQNFGGSLGIRRTPVLMCTADRSKVTCQRCLIKLAKLDAARKPNSSDSPAFAVMRTGMVLTWFFARPQAHYDTPIEPGACPFCLKVAVCGLPPPLLSVQPDKTTHVCCPALGGCNQGFTLT